MIRAIFILMTPHLEDKLAQDYPQFFTRRSPNASCGYWSGMLDKPQHRDTRRTELSELGMSDVCWCDDGWYRIIHDFCYLTKGTLEHARHVLSREGKLTVHQSPKFEFIQIKEKLGTLRLYYKLWQSDAPVKDIDPRDIELRLLEITREIDGYRAFAYLLSSKTCELSGSAARLRIRGGELKTLSKDKAVELGFEDLPPDHALLNG